MVSCPSQLTGFLWYLIAASCITWSWSWVFPSTESVSCSVVSIFLQPWDCSPAGSSVHGIFQARKLVGCHFLLQGIFPTQGSNPCLLYLANWQVDSLPALPGKPFPPMHTTQLALLHQLPARHGCYNIYIWLWKQCTWPWFKFGNTHAYGMQQTDLDYYSNVMLWSSTSIIYPYLPLFLFFLNWQCRFKKSW